MIANSGLGANLRRERGILTVLANHKFHIQTNFIGEMARPAGAPENININKKQRIFKHCESSESNNYTISK